jgi:hypothetical protein
VTSYTLTAPGVRYCRCVGTYPNNQCTGSGNPTTAAGAQPGIGTGFTINLDVTPTQNGTITATLYYSVIT